MYLFKYFLLLVSCGVTLTLIVALFFQLREAAAAPYRLPVTGLVAEVIAPPEGDADRVPSSGPQVVVEFKDQDGRQQRKAFSSFNSGGRTEFHGKNPGETVTFELQLDSKAPGAVKTYDWREAGKVYMVMGASLAAVGLLLFLL